MSCASTRQPNGASSDTRSLPTKPQPMMPTTRPVNWRPASFWNEPARRATAVSGTRCSNAIANASVSSATERRFTPPVHASFTPCRAIADRSKPSSPTPYLLMIFSSGSCDSTASSIRSSPTMAASRPRSSVTSSAPSSRVGDALNVTSGWRACSSARRVALAENDREVTVIRVIVCGQTVYSSDSAAGSGGLTVAPLALSRRWLRLTQNHIFI